MIRSLIVAAAMLLPQSAASQQAPLLVDVAWLAQHIDDANLVMLHVGDERQYQLEHIPGARYIPFDAISTPHDETQLALELPHPDTMRRRLEALGVSDDSRIIVYYASQSVSPATRVYFTLEWLGLGGQTSILNGGMPAWKRARHPVTAAVPAARSGRLSSRRLHEFVVDHTVAASAPTRSGFKLVDGRAAVYYNGIEPTQGRSGHIPGALSIPYTSVVDDDLMFDATRLRQQFRDAGVGEGDVVIGYCHIGQQATAMLFAARVIGHDVRLYDGSFQDWATRNRGDVVR